jgi:hypothetical protein
MSHAEESRDPDRHQKQRVHEHEGGQENQVGAALLVMASEA